MRYERLMEWCGGRWLATAEMLKHGFVLDEEDLACLASNWQNIEVVRDTTGGYICVTPRMSADQIKAAHRFPIIEAACAAAITLSN